jgi:hypothetical protein
MRNMLIMAVAAIIFVCGRAHALGIDIGPVHVHGTKVKVGNTIDLKIVADSITKDDDKVTKIKAHRKGDDDDQFSVKVVWKELDDKSQELLKELKEDKIYQAKLEKLDDDWKLLKIRKIDEE